MFSKCFLTLLTEGFGLPDGFILFVYLNFRFALIRTSMRRCSTI